MTSQALPAWNVVRIRWPVRAAWSAISAVSLSRISPMAMTSGSWRSRDFRPDSRVSPAAGLTWACETPGDDRLDGVLQGRQAALARPSRRQLPQTGVDRGRLAAPGRTAQDDGPRGFVEDVREPVADLAGQSEVVEPEEPPGRREHPDDGLLAEDGRERAEPHLDLARHAPDPTLLRHVVPIGQQLRQDLEPRDDVGRHLHRQHADRLQDAVDSPAQLQPVGAGLEVDVAGPRLGPSASTRSTTSVA